MVICLPNGPVIRNEELPPDSHTLFNRHPMYKDNASQLLAIQPKVIGPMGLLYVQQREFAVTVPHDKHVSIIGTDDATTCIIVVLRHSGSGVVGLSHFDGCGVDECITLLIQRIQELSIGYPEGRLELQLIGGYSDPRRYSEDLFFRIFQEFHKHPAEVDLTLCCVGELNTTIRAGIQWPIIYGIGVNVKTGEIFPATFMDKGPEQALRSARHFTGGRQVLDIYDSNLGMLRIGPFNYDPLRGADLWLQQSDDFILQHLSTSPDVEPPHYVMEVRNTLRYILENPFPSVTIFPDNRPHYYRRDEHGNWSPVRY